MNNTLRLPTPPMETPDPPSDTPGASKQLVLTPHDIPRSLRVVHEVWVGVKYNDIIMTTVLLVRSVRKEKNLNPKKHF